MSETRDPLLYMAGAPWMLPSSRVNLTSFFVIYQNFHLHGKALFLQGLHNMHASTHLEGVAAICKRTRKRTTIGWKYLYAIPSAEELLQQGQHATKEEQKIGARETENILSHFQNIFRIFQIFLAHLKI